MAGELIPLVIGILAVLILWLLAWQLLRALSGLARGLLARLPQAAGYASARTLREWLERRLPRTTRWLAARLDPRRFQGLPLTLMALAAIYIVSLLGGLIGELREAEGLVRFDNAVNAWLTPYRNAPTEAVFAWITDLGSSAAIVAVAVIASGLVWVHGHGYVVAPLWTTVLGSQVTTYTGKFELGRARPEFLTDVTAATPSFPSGHATGAMAVYGFMAYIMARDLTTLRQRFEIVYWAAILIVAIGFSRIYLSVHYVSDVAAGFLVGGFWLLVGFALAEQLRRRPRS